jgi:hypothetical protein
VNTLVYTEGGGQFNHYCHKQVAIFAVLFENRHAFSFHPQYYAGLGYLAHAVNLNAVAIQMLNILGEAK